MQQAGDYRFTLTAKAKATVYLDFTPPGVTPARSGFIVTAGEAKLRVIGP